jgi:hypothetical protein
MNWILARLSEPSTWRGLVWLLTAFGVSLRPEVWQQITAVGMAVAGLIGVVTREKSQMVNIELPPIELVGKSSGFGDRNNGSVAVSPVAVEPPPAASVPVHTGSGRVYEQFSNTVSSERDCGPGEMDTDSKTGWNG